MRRRTRARPGRTRNPTAKRRHGRTAPRDLSTHGQGHQTKAKRSHLLCLNDTGKTSAPAFRLSSRSGAPRRDVYCELCWRADQGRRARRLVAGETMERTQPVERTAYCATAHGSVRAGATCGADGAPPSSESSGRARGDSRAARPTSESGGEAATSPTRRRAHPRRRPRRGVKWECQPPRKEGTDE